jgi:alpha-ketoglutarate-dependent taurine dioxygenase
MALATTSTTFDVEPITATLGARITGIDLSDPLPEDIVEQIRSALFEYQVIFFPAQHLTPDAQVAFAKVLGEVTQPSAVIPSLDDAHPEIVAFTNENQRSANYPNSKYAGWHVDITFRSTPPLAAVFSVVTLPPVGGDTLFVSAQVAYDRLSDPLKRALQGLVAVHRTDNQGKIRELYPEFDWEAEESSDAVRHPVVAAHPVTGKPVLFVNPGFTSSIEGLSRLESDALLELLYDHTLQHEHIVRYRWAEGDVAVWDNRAVWHRKVTDYDDQRFPREVHRVQLRGGRPVAAG